MTHSLMYELVRYTLLRYTGTSTGSALRMHRVVHLRVFPTCIASWRSNRALAVLRLLQVKSQIILVNRVICGMTERGESHSLSML